MRKFGLDQPIWNQYLNYLGQMARLDLGQSIAFFPTSVSSMLWAAIPWSVGLLLTAVLISFSIGTLIGALIWVGKCTTILGTDISRILCFFCRAVLFAGVIIVIRLCVSV